MNEYEGRDFLKNIIEESENINSLPSYKELKTKYKEKFEGVEDYENIENCFWDDLCEARDLMPFIILDGTEIEIIYMDSCSSKECRYDSKNGDHYYADGLYICMDCGAWSRDVEELENELIFELPDDKMLTTPYNLMLPYDWSDERCKEFILKYFVKPYRKSYSQLKEEYAEQYKQDYEEKYGHECRDEDIDYCF